MSNKIGRRDFLGTVAFVGAAAAAAGRTSLINSAEAATATATTSLRHRPVNSLTLFGRRN
jgi:nitrous oxide reductase